MDETVHDLITRKKGSFKKTFSAISKLWDKNVPMQINCPIMKQNYESYKDVLDWASSMNIEASSDYTLFGSYDCSQSNLYCRLNDKEIKKIIISSKTDIDKDPNQSTKLKHNNEDDYFCPVCKNSLCISNTGYIYPCEGWQGLKLGNLKNHTLKDIWNNNPTVIHLRNLRNKDFPKCLVCQNRRYCSPCLIMNANEDINGDYMKINHYMCNLARIKGQCLNS